MPYVTKVWAKTRKAANKKVRETRADYGEEIKMRGTRRVGKKTKNGMNLYAVRYSKLRLAKM